MYILIGLVVGLVVGWGLDASINDGTPASAARLKEIAGYISIVSKLFLQLIKMIIAPLVFSTLVAGIAHMGDTGTLGRVGLRSLAWFICASLLSLSLGLALVNLIQPGVGLHLALPVATADASVDTSAFDLVKFIVHIVPSSMVGAMAADNQILQIVVFSVFVGVAIIAVGEKAAPLVRAVEALVAVMLQITNYVMLFAPFAVCAAVAAALAEHGPGVIGDLAYFMGSVYVGLLVLWVVLIAVGFLFIGPRVGSLLRHISAPLMLGFSTASSEAAYPRLLEGLERFGVPPKIASFVLPLGYSFNLDGSMMYMTFASLFIAQAYGIHLSLGQQITMLLILMVTSKGIAGVPRASLVVITATLPIFKIPDAGVLLVLAVDQFLDMGRTATNVIGNAIAATVVTKWEGALGDSKPVEIEPLHAPSHGISGQA
jgi:Na+/H+-dicarboxylate symporter